ncbi:MAG: hypothetical protein ACFCUT_21570 [Kiloniellaceae bacterium]
MGARNSRLSAVLATALAAMPLALPQAEAAVIAVASTPAKVAVVATGPATVSVTWRVERQELEPSGPGTVSSPRLRILIGGAVVADLSRPLARELPGVATNETTTFRETVQIPEALIYRAVKQGSPLRVVRAFADNPIDTPLVAELLVTPSGQGSAALHVERLALNFDDDTRSRVLPKGSELRVVAELNIDGVGLVTGQWEVASGATSAGTPVFRPLSLVRQGVAGGGRTVITSPRLPTAEEGTAFVRFRVIEPALTIDAPTLQYYVTPRAPETLATAQREIVVAAPRPGDSLTAQTRFAWSALDTAETYQLAFYATPAGPAAPLDPTTVQQPGAAKATGGPLAGLFVPGDRSEASPEAFTLTQLPGGRSYLWRVLAIDANGAVIGSSSIREIFKP